MRYAYDPVLMKVYECEKGYYETKELAQIALENSLIQRKLDLEELVKTSNNHIGKIARYFNDKRKYDSSH